jgi:hypothetical protein
VISEPCFEIDPAAIHLVPVKDGEMIRLQKDMSKATWRVCPGRRLPFRVMHGDKLIGLLNLSSPGMNLGPRDRFLKLDNDYTIRGKQLRNYMDLSVCVGVQPLAWFWNLGKLMALVATCKEIADLFQAKYGDRLIGIQTFSLFGRSCQYNRVYRFLGFTKGNGNEHIPEEKYKEIRAWLKERRLLPERRGRMWAVKEWNKHQARENKVPLTHGKIRGIYYLECTGRPLAQIAESWYGRWGLPRYLAHKNENPPYLTGLA